MDRLTKLRDWAAKYKYVIAVVLLGVLLMLLPSGSRREPRSAASGFAPRRARRSTASIIRRFSGICKIIQAIQGAKGL